MVIRTTRFMPSRSDVIKATSDTEYNADSSFSSTLQIVKQCHNMLIFSDFHSNMKGGKTCGKRIVLDGTPQRHTYY